MGQQNTSKNTGPTFQGFWQAQARLMRAKDRAPGSLAEWKQEREQLRKRLTSSWGGFPEQGCDLKPKVVGQFEREGYRVEKLLLQTRPGVWMTANAYVPDGAGRKPAVLCVHGHWRLAKQEAVVQSRCIGLAKLGFFVLMVDAFGAGERGIGKALGEYHGEMVAATLWPSGLSLAGLQVYENRRAVDYLLTRPEVDGKRIGVTGASGGGNQTMYAGAMDERLKCVVPVCSVGTYQAYLKVACCMCEVTPGALSYTEEARVLSLVAPRGLMIINASRDGVQFSIAEAKKSIAAARPIFGLYGKEANLRHATFESGHDYNRSMREAMYGWMTLHLKGQGDGAPVKEPSFNTEEPETLRCYPGNSRPDGFVTLPRFAAAEGRRLLGNRPAPDHVESWESEEMMMRHALPRVLGGFPKPTPTSSKVLSTRRGHLTQLKVEADLQITAIYKASGKKRGLVVLLDLDKGEAATESEMAGELLKDGWDILAPTLRGTASAAPKSDRIGRAPDHNSAEWSLWMGRPLLGQWAWDVRRLLDVIGRYKKKLPENVAVCGLGSAATLALVAAALDRRVSHAAAVDGLVSYVADVPFEKQRLGIMVPGILRDVGDIPQIAALASPKRLVIAGGRDAAGKSQTAKQLQEAYAWTRSIYALRKQPKQFRVTADTTQLARLLRE